MGVRRDRQIDQVFCGRFWRDQESLVGGPLSSTKDGGFDRGLGQGTECCREGLFTFSRAQLRYRAAT